MPNYETSPSGSPPPATTKRPALDGDAGGRRRIGGGFAASPPPTTKRANPSASPSSRTASPLAPAANMIRHDLMGLTAGHRLRFGDKARQAPSSPPRRR
jgi:hypothetical protein